MILYCNYKSPLVTARAEIIRKMMHCYRVHSYISQNIRLDHLCRLLNFEMHDI